MTSVPVSQLEFPLTVPPLSPEMRHELLGVLRLDWQADAACTDTLTGNAAVADPPTPDPVGGDWAPPDPFYPEPDRVAEYEVGKLICRSCPVRVSCLAAALVGGEGDGLWGGASPQDRDRIKVNIALGDPLRVALGLTPASRTSKGVAA
jgi:hypothetical protein